MAIQLALEAIIEALSHCGTSIRRRLLRLRKLSSKRAENCVAMLSYGASPANLGYAGLTCHRSLVQLNVDEIDAYADWVISLHVSATSAQHSVTLLRAIDHKR